ncbi:MAG TPA: NAD(P)/FAD-dependent oxidoreductase [Lachnospiraceae bacterium]|nr:NAD(P)/FAD-dependent oxidoreductase [Lachnospiraceae bacterium]
MSKVIIVGGGAAGMMAAIAAAENGHQVKLIEKNDKLGKKIYITGKGRCNVTNACEMEDFFNSVVSNPKFLYSACYTFDNSAVIRMLEENGCNIKIERGDRAFPVSDHASDVIKALQKKMDTHHVKVYLKTKVKEVLVENHIVIGVLLEDKTTLFSDSVIITTGGLSYITTGSDGDGYRFAKQTGHQVTNLSPALVPLQVKEKWCLDLQGLALKNISILVEKDQKKVYEGFGEMLFTHFGVSGPLILSASSYISKNTKDCNCLIHLDLKPALSLEQLDKRLLRDFEEHNNKQFKNAVSGLFPSKLIPVMIQLSGINPDKKINEISKEERLQFVSLIKNVKITVVGTRDYNEAIITQGGISIKDLNPSTMESKLVKGLHFAGEVLDLDALTGGFNLQIAWSTGFLAGSSIE